MRSCGDALAQFDAHAVIECDVQKGGAKRACLDQPQRLRRIAGRVGAKAELLEKRAERFALDIVRVEHENIGRSQRRYGCGNRCETRASGGPARR